MCLYYSARQARERDYKGPDFFVVKPTDGQRQRKAWIVWEEDGQLGEGGYAPLAPDPQRRLRSAELQLSLGPWTGVYQNISAVWLRFFDASGQLIPTAEERASAAGI
jgi:hypothetical protein